jgi:16S rRNA (adenine1518-N6/adenine1519-N6)-dimethyltransferase
MFLTPQQFFRLNESRPRKRFGQHFLAQTRTAERIVESAGLKDSDVVVEIGPGLGALTQFILPRVRRLDLVELDRDLATYLKESISSTECRFFVHQQDVLEFDFVAVSREEAQQLIILGNLPYNITSPLIFHLLESMSSLKRAVFMVQKEVGERLAADPGTKDYGVLSVLLGACARVTPLFSVGPTQFYPHPKVDSLVLRIDLDPDRSMDASSFNRLRRIVNAAFQQRRKTLQNSLKSLVGKNAILMEKVFERSGIDPMRRPETLSSDEFLNLAGALQVESGLDEKS